MELTLSTQNPSKIPQREAGCSAPSCSAGWFSGEAPKDGKTYVAIGRVTWSDDYCGGSTPFLSHVRYAYREGWEGWLDERHLAISEGIDDVVHIDHWIPLPNSKG